MGLGVDDPKKYDCLVGDVEDITTEQQLAASYPAVVKFFKGSTLDALNFLAVNLRGLDLDSMTSFFSSLRLEKSIYCHLIMNAALYKGHEKRFLEAERCCLKSLRIPDLNLMSLRLMQRNVSPRPLVSVLCPVYNQKFFIDRTIRGLLAQTMKDIEIIISDDCSCDGTSERLLSWQRRFPGVIKIVRMTENVHAKQKSPLELLIRLSSGRYLSFCDGDDFWIDPNRLERQFCFLEQRSNLVSCSYNMVFWDTINGTRSFASPTHFSRIDYPDNLKKVSNLLWTNTLVCRKEFSQLPGEFLLTRGRDSILTSFLGYFGGNVHQGSVLGAVQRRTSTSFWNPMSDEQKNAMRYVTRLAIKKLLCRYESYHLSDYCDWRIERLGISEQVAAELSSMVLDLENSGVDRLRIKECEFESFGF